MGADNAGFSIDIGSLSWGRPPVPLLPGALRNLWKTQPLPKWLLLECGLPDDATIGILGTDYWRFRPQATVRLQHFVDFLVRNRIKGIKKVRCTDQAWPLGLEVPDIPFSTRSAKALKASGLFKNKEALSQVTFGQLFKLQNLGVRSVLEIATLIEAAIRLHSRATEELARSFAASEIEQLNMFSDNAAVIDSANDSVLESGARWASVLADALQESWIDQIDERDRRFRSLLPPGHGTLEERIEKVIADPASGSVHVPALVACLPRIRAAVERMTNVQTLEDSLLELLILHMGAELPRVHVIAARLGWLGEAPKTLQECGDILNVTRERVRQIESKVIKQFTNHALYLPRLDAALAVLEEAAPCPADHAARLLVERGISKRPFSPVSVLQAASLFGRKTTLSVEEHRGDRVLVLGDQGHVLGALTRWARKLAGQSGIASVYMVADALAQSHSGSSSSNIDESDVRKILKSQPGYEFLDEDWFWFTAIPEGRNRLENLSKKILSVASPQSIASIREGVRRAFRWRSITNERYRTLTVPPQAVMARFFKRHPDFVLNADLVKSAKRLDYRKLLGESERILVTVLHDASAGVVDRRTLVRECLSRGINENTLAVLTTYSSILEHTGVGLWQLRGVRVDPAAVEAVREQNALRPKTARVQDFGWSPDGKLWIAWKVPGTTGSPVLGIPGAVRRYVANQSFSARPKSVERAIGTVSVTEDGTSYGYGPFFRYSGADEGDTLRAEFDLSRTEVSLSLNEDGLLEDADT